MRSRKKNDRENLSFHPNAFELALKPDEKSTVKLQELSNALYKSVPKHWRGPRPSTFNMKLIGYTSCVPSIIKTDVANPFTRILQHRIDETTHFTFSQAGYDPTFPGSVSITPPKNNVDWTTLGGLKICTMLHPKLNRSNPAFSGFGDKVESDLSEPSFEEIYRLVRKAKNVTSEEITSLAWVHIDLFYPNVREREFDPDLYMLECGHLKDLIYPIDVRFKSLELQGNAGRYPAQMYIEF